MRSWAGPLRWGEGLALLAGLLWRSLLSAGRSLSRSLHTKQHHDQLAKPSKYPLPLVPMHPSLRLMRIGKFMEMAAPHPEAHALA